MRLDYFLHEGDYEPEAYSGDCDDMAEQVKVYGIEVKKTEADSSESEYVADFTTNEGLAMKMLRLLADNHVTPCCLRDVLDDACANM